MLQIPFVINKCCAPCTHRCWERSVKCSFVGMGLSKVWALLSQCCPKRNGKTPGLGNQTSQPQLYMWTGHQDLPANKFLDCSDKNMLKNLTYNMWRKWNYLTTCAELWWTFLQLFLTGKILSQMTPHKHHLVLILCIIQMKSRVLEWRMLHFDPEVENIRIWINVWKESKSLLSTLTLDTLQQRFPLPMNKTALGLFLPPNIQGVNLSNCSKLHQYTISGGMCTRMGIMWKIYKAENKN